MINSKNRTTKSKLNSPAELEALRKSIVEKRDPDKPCVVICGGTGCLALGAAGVVTAFRKEIREQELEAKVDLKVTGCHGFCEKGPHVLIRPQGILYPRIKESDIAEIISKTIVKGDVIDRLLYTDPSTGQKIVYEQEVPFYKRQKRIIFGNNGYITPNAIDDYLALGGYSALSKALFEMTPEGVIEEVKKAGLRGRGGGGFPTGVKWESCRQAHGDTKYIICNCDEGD
ncbi:MAG TPA: NADH-quinone oxidoreductase subunit F, partial [Dehalococcoidia bacterium]|nr:NADH-quinone oxidoreductase subunit F [Dehalococcoidia bacterium]